MIRLNNLSSSLVKIAEYLLLTLVIGQIALGKFNSGTFLWAILAAGLVYFLSTFILQGYEKVK